MCASIPKNANDWQSMQLHVALLLEQACTGLEFEKKQQEGCRGQFPALNVGISHGGGQTYPKTLGQSIKNAPIIKKLMEDSAFERISGFATGIQAISPHYNSLLTSTH